MGLESVKRYSDLKQELSEAKETLFNLNDNIRRIVGRNHNIRSEKHKIYEVKRNDERQLYRLNEGPRSKRRSYDAKSVFQRLSGPTRKDNEEEEESRPRLTSRVIRELPSRQEIVAVQCADSASRERNRRMFGCLLGTLHKFSQEETKLKKKEEKKAKIEKKLEEQEIQEKESLKKERESLFLDRKRKQIEIRKLELKMNLLKDFEVWEKAMCNLKSCIKTKGKPSLYYKPKILNKRTEKLIKENTLAIDLIIEKRKDALQKEIADIENNVKLSDVDLDADTEVCGSKVEPQSSQEKELLEKIDGEPIVLQLNNDELFERRNICEPVVSSSVVVVNNFQKQSTTNE